MARGTEICLFRTSKPRLGTRFGDAWGSTKNMGGTDVIFSNNIGIQSIVRYDMMGMCNGIMRYVYIYIHLQLCMYMYIHINIYIYICTTQKRIGFKPHLTTPFNGYTMGCPTTWFLNPGRLTPYYTLLIK